MSAARRKSVRRAPSPWRNPGAGGERLEVEDFPTFQLARLAFAAQRLLTKNYTRQFGLSIPEWRLLALLARSAPMPFGRLSTTTSMDKAQVSRALRLVTAKGLVDSTPDPRHRRRVLVAMTPKGVALYRRLLPVARRQQMRLLDLLTAAERVVLHTALNKMHGWAATVSRQGAGTR